MKNILSLSLLLASLSGCAHLPQSRLPAIREASSSAVVDRQFQIAAWWHDLGDPQLDILITQVLSRHPEARLADAWVSRSAAAARAEWRAGALAVDAEIARSRGISGKNAKNESGFSLRTSLDVGAWGAGRYQRQAHNAALKSVFQERLQREVALSAEVAEAWFNFVYATQQLRLLDSQLSLNRNHLSSLEARARRGLAEPVDLHHQRLRLKETEAQRAAALGEHAQAEHALTYFGIKSGSGAPPTPPDTWPELSFLPVSDLTADLLTNRPDVLAAKADIEKADRLLAMAVVDLLPQLKLSLLGESLRDGRGIWSSPFWALASGVVAPLLDGGHRRAVIDLRRAETTELIWQFEKRLLLAARQTNDAIHLETQERARHAALEQALAAARAAFRAAHRRYQTGVDEYLPVLTALRSVQETELALLQSQHLVTLHRIQLHRTIAGAGHL